MFVPPYQSHRSGFDLCFDYIPFCVVEHWKLRAEKSEDCLSDSEFRSARTKLKRTEKPKANTVGWSFFWYLFFAHSKIRYSAIKGEKPIVIQPKIKKDLAREGRNQSAVRQHNKKYHLHSISKLGI